MDLNVRVVTELELVLVEIRSVPKPERDGQSTYPFAVVDHLYNGDPRA